MIQPWMGNPRRRRDRSSVCTGGDASGNRSAYCRNAASSASNGELGPGFGRVANSCCSDCDSLGVIRWSSQAAMSSLGASSWQAPFGHRPGDALQHRGPQSLQRLIKGLLTAARLPGNFVDPDARCMGLQHELVLAAESFSRQCSSTLLRTSRGDASSSAASFASNSHTSSENTSGLARAAGGTSGLRSERW